MFRLISNMPLHRFIAIGTLTATQLAAGAGALALSGAAGLAVGRALSGNTRRSRRRNYRRRRYYRRGRRAAAEDQEGEKEAELTAEERAEEDQVEALFYRASQLDGDACFKKLICELVDSRPEMEVKNCLAI